MMKMMMMINDNEYFKKLILLTFHIPPGKLEICAGMSLSAPGFPLTGNILLATI